MASGSRKGRSKKGRQGRVDPDPLMDYVNRLLSEVPDALDDLASTNGANNSSFVEQVLQEISSSARSNEPAQESSMLVNLPSEEDMNEFAGVVLSMDKGLMLGEYSEQLKAESWTSPSVEEEDEEDTEEDDEDPENMRMTERRMGMIEGKFARQLFSLRYFSFCI